MDEDKSDDTFVVIKEVTDWQIVNGGQTTASIYNALQTGIDISSVNVQINLRLLEMRVKQKKW